MLWQSSMIDHAVSSRALALIEQTERRLAEVWAVHRIRLNHCLGLRHFEEDFKEVQGDYMRLYDDLIHFADLTSSAFVSPTSSQTLDQKFLQLDDLSQRTQVGTDKAYFSSL